ncbi:hypothetical protein GCM10011609_04560 [Lentzea pudingi]|uniref:Uncharacterized protein n=1 Tax=Lentzea pudingi TaxID=1789439 RepID=A0ABQ2HB29_9PSEU|nr:hypothetical protein GCM10011609_04560 [Lentzea pudingi]
MSAAAAASTVRRIDKAPLLSAEGPFLPARSGRRRPPKVVTGQPGQSGRRCFWRTPRWSAIWSWMGVLITIGLVGGVCGVAAGVSWLSGMKGA